MTDAAMKVRARVYTKDGNRFLIPGHWYCDDDPEIGMGSAANVICDSLMWGVICGLKADGWIDLEADENGHGTVTHYSYDMRGRQFAHGGVKVLLIGGPMFDEEQAVAQQLAEMSVST